MHQPLASSPHSRHFSADRLRPGLLLPLIALAIAALVVPLLIVLNAPKLVPVERAVARARPAQRVIPKVELPPVEPAMFVAIDPADARAYNASIPFSRAPLLAARPFRVTGDADSIARATDCLAAGVLYEAGDDTVGQRAVAQVILNRLRHPAFPKSICSVVFQGAERQTGCQFTFTCDGALARRYSDAAWNRAREVAAAALTGRVEKAVGTATHYHTNWVVPYWSASLDKISEIQTHLFFRWTGWWGTPPAFRGRYAGTEPLIGKLRAIAPAHAAAAPDAAGEVAIPGIVLIDPAAIAAEALPQALETDPNTFLVTLDPRMSPNDFAGWALRACGERPYCKFQAWADRADTPAAWPADPRQMARMAFSFLRDRRHGFERAFWNCERYARTDAGQCMKPRLSIPTNRTEAPKPGAPPGTVPATPPAVELTGIRRKTGTLAPAVPAPTAPIVAPPPVPRANGS